MSEPQKDIPSSGHIAKIRGQVRSALITKKKGEARRLLAQLILMVNDEGAKHNLTSLLQGVAKEVGSYVTASGDIRERLLNEESLDVIQNELDEELPHWRAFVGDFKVLKLAQKGLDAHEDPAVKLRIKELEKSIAKGSVSEVLEEWESMGRPDFAADGTFIQVITELLHLQACMKAENWEQAKSPHKKVHSLIASGEATKFNPGLENYLKGCFNTIRWELLLQRATNTSSLGRKERNTFLEELFTAKAEIQMAVSSGGANERQLERVDALIEKISLAYDLQPEGKSSVTIVLIVFLLLGIVILIVVWIYMRDVNTVTMYLERSIDEFSQACSLRSKSSITISSLELSSKKY